MPANVRRETPGQPEEIPAGQALYVPVPAEDWVAAPGVDAAIGAPAAGRAPLLRHGRAGRRHARLRVHPDPGVKRGTVLPHGAANAGAAHVAPLQLLAGHDAPSGARAQFTRQLRAPQASCLSYRK